MNETGIYVRTVKDDGGGFENKDIANLSEKQREDVATMWADFERERRIGFISSLLKIIKEL